MYSFYQLKNKEELQKTICKKCNFKKQHLYNLQCNHLICKSCIQYNYQAIEVGPPFFLQTFHTLKCPLVECDFKSEVIGTQPIYIKQEQDPYAIHICQKCFQFNKLLFQIECKHIYCFQCIQNYFLNRRKMRNQLRDIKNVAYRCDLCLSPISDGMLKQILGEQIEEINPDLTKEIPKERVCYFCNQIRNNSDCMTLYCQCGIICNLCAMNIIDPVKQRCPSCKARITSQEVFKIYEFRRIMNESNPLKIF